MDTVVGLDLGERCVGTRRALCRREPLPNRRGSRRSRRDVLRCDGRAGPRRIKLPQRLTRRRHDLHPACSGLADGNSVIIKQRMCGTSALCNEQTPDSVSPYGGQGELLVHTNPPALFHVLVTNTPREQRLEVRRVADDKFGTMDDDASEGIEESALTERS
jgi:hypothetical protein